MPYEIPSTGGLIAFEPTFTDFTKRNEEMRGMRLSNQGAELQNQGLNLANQQRAMSLQQANQTFGQEQQANNLALANKNTERVQADYKRSGELLNNVHDMPSYIDAIKQHAKEFPDLSPSDPVAEAVKIFPNGQYDQGIVDAIKARIQVSDQLSKAEQMKLGMQQQGFDIQREKMQQDEQFHQEDLKYKREALEANAKKGEID